jgi:hypothetical protein
MGPRMQWDRLKENIAAIVRGSLPRLDYYANYYGRVVKFDEPRQQVDVVPDDARLPTMQGVPLRGPAGAHWTIDVAGSPSVLITWENADPARPVAFGFGTGAHVLSLTLNADQIYLGGTDGAEPAAKGTTLQAYLNALAALLAAHTHGITVDPSLALPAITPPNIQATNALVK